MKLRNLLLIFVVMGLLGSVAGCSTSGSSTTSKEYEERQSNPEENWTLKDHLQRASGVRVTGTGSATRVIIRGESTTANPSSQPLFVIDGQKAGRSFGDVDDMLYEGEIKYIEVIPPSRAAQYGMQGLHGVIRIFTR